MSESRSRLDALLERIGVYEKIRASEPHRITKLLEGILDEVERRTGYSHRTSWDILVELLGHSLGLTTTRYRKLLLGLNGQIQEYINEAVEEPWDYLGEVFTDRRLGNPRLGQNLTPRFVVELLVKMTVGEEKFDMVKTVLDPCVGTGRFLLAASMLYPEAPLALYGIEIDVSLYRACLVNMCMFSRHPYHILCADALRLDSDFTYPNHPLWKTLSNKWNPPDMTPYYVKPSPISATSFSLKAFSQTRKPQPFSGCING